MLVLGVMLLSAAANAQPSAKTFDMYVVDTEGGHATLYVSPTGETLLEDTGNPGTRDPDRIMEVIKAAGVKQIDHLIITHYHVDHIGGLEDLAKRIEIKHYIDHGPTVEAREQVADFQAKYAALYSKAKHTVAKPGDKIPLGAVDVTVVTSAKQVIKKAAAGQPESRIRPAPSSKRCGDSSYPGGEQGIGGRRVHLRQPYRSGESRRLGAIRKRNLIMSPSIPIGHVSLMITPHHGINQSNSVALIHGLAPTVAIMHNSARKGGALTTMQNLWTSPGLQDLWQIHWAYAAGLDYNTPGLFIANLDDPDTIAGVISGAIPAGGGGLGGGRGGCGAGGRGAAGAPPGAVPTSGGRGRRIAEESGGPGRRLGGHSKPRGLYSRNVGAFGRIIHSARHGGTTLVRLTAEAKPGKVKKYDGCTPVLLCGLRRSLQLCGRNARTDPKSASRRIQAERDRSAN